ncbi:MAG: sulfatase-like hydrolase/transferase [bacterium]|nr:sulfatase-like hydrolase/transferase [bacterium]
MIDRPNVLLVHTDQHRYDCVGANGHPFLQTPHLDRLAREGVNFSHAFSPVPVCIPARNSLLYGQWPTEHLAIANWNTEAPRPATGDARTMTACLKEAGYQLDHVGKWHIHPTRGPERYGYGRDVPESDYEAWRAEQGYGARPNTQGWFGETDSEIPAQASHLAWEADRVIEALDEASSPFFIHWETNEPHLPNVVAEPFASMYRPEDCLPWPGFDDPLSGKPYIQAQQRRTWGIEHWGWNRWAPIVARYLGEISLLDAQIGRVLDALDRSGLAENTLVIYTPDHGDMCGSHGMVDKHYVMYDDIIRVPLIMRWPGRLAPGVTRGDFVVYALDVAATICNAAGVEPPGTFRGMSLLEKQTGREDILAMYHGNQFGLFSQRMVRGVQWKVVWNATAEDELYDLVDDPGEIHNRAMDRACRDVLTHFRHRLVAWMEEIRDPLLNHWNRDQLMDNRSR